MRQSTLNCSLANEIDTERLGRELARTLPENSKEILLGLSGELGAGKTTLARAFLRAVGVTGPVKSPTYTLLEPYEVEAGRVLHFDLYRLSAGDELEVLGYRDLRAGSWLAIVEWPERGGAALGNPDVLCELAYAGPGRRATLTAVTGQGRAWLGALAASWRDSGKGIPLK